MSPPQTLPRVDPVLLPPNGVSASLRRIGALVRRYIYLLRSSGVRLVELIYWPFLQMLTWGFLQEYLAGTDPQDAATAWLKANAAVLDGWLNGVTTKDGGDAKAAVMGALEG